MKMLVVTAFALLSVCSCLRVEDNPGGTEKKEFHTPDGAVTLIIGKQRARSINFDTPQSFQVKSKILKVKSNEDEGSRREGRNLKRFSKDENGVPVIEGVREPDDPNDKRIFRNARVINNVLVTDEEDRENQVRISRQLPEFKSSPRKGRILTGSSDSSVAQTDQSSFKQQQQQQQPPFFQHFYNPSRSGPASEGSSHSDEKVVSYSYSTSESEGRKPGKDVIYGSGFAANPNRRKKEASKPLAPNGNHLKPSITWSDFHSSPSLTSSSSSGSTFRFPSQGDSSSSPFSSSSSSNSNFQNANNAAQRSPFKRFQHGTLSQAQPQFQAVPSSSYSNIYSNYQNNQIRRHQQNTANFPTPHKAFGAPSNSLIHPSIVPADPQNFIIEPTTFQSHPGAPAFSIPVPRPAPQFQDSSSQRYEGQNGFHPSNQFAGAYPYYYQDYIEEIDNRPLIDKMMDPLRRVGERVRENVIMPVLDAGEKFGNSLRIPERVDKIANGNVDADAVPLVGGAVAVAALGALGAYAASKYTMDDIKNLLPQAATRSTKSNANVQDILLKLADDLENEDPSFLERFTSSTDWLESSCARRIFCSLVTSTIQEEAEKIEEDNVKKAVESEVTEVKKTDENNEGLQSREARRFLEKEVNYLEKQINSLINNFKVDISGGKNKSLRQAAKDIVSAVRNRNCSAFACTKKNR